jgi:TPR repeat protein
MAFLRGQGTERTPELAAHWLTQAANRRDARGMNAFGLAYEEGFGVAQSYRWARHWYEVAAMEKNDGEAMRNLARLHRKGLGTVRHDSMALAWYLKAVGTGSVEAMVDVGTMYAEGLDGRRDANQALGWYQRAADVGSPRAMHAIGRLYEDARNFGQALAWYRKAAGAGSAEAMNNLGVLYQNGWGVTPDRAEASHWYRLAAEAGSPAAAGNLTVLEGG